MKRFLAPVLLGLALAASGCGSDSGGDAPPASSGATGDAVAIGMKDLEFVPADQAVKTGQRVVWTNNESIQHNVVATDGADFESEVFGQDGTFEYTPTEAGTISYTCTLHPGMDGTLTVK